MSLVSAVDFKCSTCGADPGDRCHRMGQPILGYHDARHALAAAHRPSFYVTFGQQYGREGEPPHPRFSWAHRDGYVTVIADDYDHARQVTISLLGTAWSDIYADGVGLGGSWEPDLFPRGELLRVIAAPRDQT